MSKVGGRGRKKEEEGEKKAAESCLGEGCSWEICGRSGRVAVGLGRYVGNTNMRVD